MVDDVAEPVDGGFGYADLAGFHDCDFAHRRGDGKAIHNLAQHGVALGAPLAAFTRLLAGEEAVSVRPGGDGKPVAGFKRGGEFGVAVGAGGHA